jgi:hypothetical protein
MQHYTKLHIELLDVTHPVREVLAVEKYHSDNSECYSINGNDWAIYSVTILTYRTERSSNMVGVDVRYFMLG